MSRHRERHRAAAAKRVRRRTVFDNPIAWMALQLIEFGIVLLVAFGLLPDASRAVRVGVLIGLAVAFVGCNYWLRRRYISGA